MTSRVLLAAALAACTTTSVQAQVEAQTLMAIGHASGNFGVGKTVSFYDISELNSSTFAQPLFYVWTGYEIPQITSPVLQPGNLEEISGITFNPVNGTMYLASYDSGTPGVVDPSPLTGDIQGDFDLYQIDLGVILDDFNTNGRSAGVLYSPTTSANGTVNPVHEDAGSTSGQVWVDAFSKVGEIARPDSPGFFDIDLEFINPETLVLVDHMDISGSGEGGITVNADHTLRLWERVSTAAGAASLANSVEGGYNGTEATQSWNSRVLTELNMDSTGTSEVGIDLDGDNDGIIGDVDDVSSNMHGIALVRNQNGTLGVWVAENDARPVDENDPNSDLIFNDQFSFFEIDLDAVGGATAAKKEFQVGPGSPFGTSFALDEDPVADSTTNDGDADTYFVDPNGNLIIVESGFQDDPQTEPKLIKREVDDYDAADSDTSGFNEIDFGSWATLAPIVTTTDDDSDVTPSLFATYDPGEGNEGYVYLFDVFGETSFLKDVYVIDVETGALVYQELDAAGLTDIFFERHTTRVVTRGDATGDGKVTAADIDAFFGVSNTGDALMQEMFSLDGDADTDLDDVTELVEEILGTFFGDANLDGTVDFLDFSALSSNFNQSGTGWATGDFNGDGTTDFLDFSALSSNFNLGSASAAELAEYEAFVSSVVPEPTSLALLGLGGLLLARRRR